MAITLAHQDFEELKYLKLLPESNEASPACEHCPTSIIKSLALTKPLSCTNCGLEETTFIWKLIPVGSRKVNERVKIPVPDTVPTAVSLVISPVPLITTVKGVSNDGGH